MKKMPIISIDQEFQSIFRPDRLRSERVVVQKLIEEQKGMKVPRYPLEKVYLRPIEPKNPETLQYKKIKQLTKSTLNTKRSVSTRKTSKDDISFVVPKNANQIIHSYRENEYDSTQLSALYPKDSFEYSHRNYEFEPSTELFSNNNSKILKERSLQKRESFKLDPNIRKSLLYNEDDNFAIKIRERMDQIKFLEENNEKLNTLKDICKTINRENVEINKFYSIKYTIKLNL